MAHIKTAVSIDEPVFKKAEKIARKMKITRSELFSRALQDFIRKRESRELFENYNEVYSETDPETEKTLAFIRAQQRRTLKGQWK